MDKKVFIFGFFLSIIFFISFSDANASLLVLQKSGEVKVNVLSATSESQIDIQKPSSLDVNQVADSSLAGDSVITLNMTGGKANLKVATDSDTKELDVTDWKEDIVEIEERPETQKVRIQLIDGKFFLKQKGISATTDQPITIDSKSAELSVKTDSGDKFLSVLPYDAVQSILKTKVINEVSNKIEILEENGNLAYKIDGQKVINFFNVYSYQIPVSGYVSTSTGEILKVDSPTIYKYITFLFV